MQARRECSQGLQSDRTMKQALTRTRMVFQGTGLPHRVDTLSSPVALRRGDLLVAVRLATICGSDLHTYAGRRSCPLPTVLGHEAVGTVVALGEGRDPALMGRRVTWTLADSCGKCVACAEWSLPQKCQTLFKYGHAALEERAACHHRPQRP